MLLDPIYTVCVVKKNSIDEDFKISGCPTIKDIEEVFDLVKRYHVFVKLDWQADDGKICSKIITMYSIWAMTPEEYYEKEIITFVNKT